MNLPKAKKLPCAELARAAEREFNAFFSAVNEMLSAIDASAAAEEWLEGFERIQLPLDSPGDMCRQVTVAAAACLARRVEIRAAVVHGAVAGRVQDEARPSTKLFRLQRLCSS